MKNIKIIFIITAINAPTNNTGPLRLLFLIELNNIKNESINGEKEDVN